MRRTISLTSTRTAALLLAGLFGAAAVAQTAAPAADRTVPAAADQTAAPAVQPTAPAAQPLAPTGTPAAGSTCCGTGPGTQEGRGSATIESPGLGIGASTSGTSGVPAEAGVVLTLEPGLYRCELNRRVTVRRLGTDGASVVVNWNGKDHTLNAVRARTGALRYEDAQAGLMWLVIVGKSMLLDTRAGKQLANECKL